MTTKTALITGITGQDGSYLAELLLEKGYKVCGIVRRNSNINTARIDHIINDIELVYGDLTENVDHVIKLINPDEIYNLASMSHVRISFDIPEYTLMTNAIGPLKILEYIRCHKNIKLYHASSSEMFGTAVPPQNEWTPFKPCSPYGIAKLAAYWLIRTYREAYNIFASNGICFNHESPRRGENFVTKKIIRGAVRIKLEKQKTLILGNLGAMRDWGYAGDYVKAMYMILQYLTPDDFVIATGHSCSIFDFMTKVFSKLDLDYLQYVTFDNKYIRPKEVPDLCGDSRKIRNILKWEPTVNLDELINMMIEKVMIEECK